MPRPDSYVPNRTDLDNKGVHERRAPPHEPGKITPGGRVGNLVGVSGPILVILVFLSFAPAASQQATVEQEPVVIGFLEMTLVFGGWDSDWQRLPPDPSFRIPLRRAPSEESEVVVQITAPEVLDAVEFRYEIVGARVFGRVGEWSLLRTRKGEFGWVAPDEGMKFYSLEDRLLEGLTYLTDAFDGSLFRTPEEGERVRIPSDPRRALAGTRTREEMEDVAEHAFGSLVRAVETLEVRWVGDSLWARVNVLSESPCEGPERPAVVATGWIRVHAPSGDLAIWYYARGC